MGEQSNSVDPTKYVVLDVETNGLSSVNDDLLSISIYRPDTEEKFNRFLPLELQDCVYTSYINGIRKSDLRGKKPLSQNEVDSIIRDFDLKNRIILTYSGIDERFIRKYFQRHKLNGIEYFAFYNFKHEIISSRFSEGNITKDNLCRIYGIENVEKVHSGINDCILEWKLYEKMNGHRLLITNNNVFEFNDQYFVPASYISTYPNFKYFLPKLPKVKGNYKLVFSLTVKNEDVLKFPTNFNGVILEHLINSMLHVQRIDSRPLLYENKKRLNYLGKLPSLVRDVPMTFRPDGSVRAIHVQDQKLADDINNNVEIFKKELAPMLDFIANTIFKNEPVKSQELMMYPDKKVLALCDLSSEDTVLEIKATQGYTSQLYYEANGRRCYLLETYWNVLMHQIDYNICEVTFDVEVEKDREVAKLEKAKQKLETDQIELLSYVDSKTPVRLRCKVCGNEWNASPRIAREHRPCPECSPKTKPIRKPIRPQETRESLRTQELRESKQTSFDMRKGVNVPNDTVPKSIDITKLTYKPFGEYLGKEILVRGFFFTNSEPEEYVVAVTDDALVKLPRRAVEPFKIIEKDRVLLEGVLTGHLLLTDIKPVVLQSGSITVSFRFKDC